MFCLILLQTRFNLSPLPHSVVETRRGADDNSVPVRYAVYDISRISGDQRTINVEVKFSEQLDNSHILPPTLTAHRFQTGNCRLSVPYVLFVVKCVIFQIFCSPF